MADAYKPPNEIQLGGRIVGKVSHREFDPDKIGTRIRKLTTENIKLTHRGIDFVEQHVSRFGEDIANKVMVKRLRDITDSKIQATPQDLNFYAHELRERVRYKLLGYPEGQPTDFDARRELWNNAHTATLEDYGIKENSTSLTSNPLYHPEAAKHFFDWR